MMPLPPFDLAQPRLVEDAVGLLAEAGEEGRILAGGTDLLVNMKQGIDSPRLLVSLSDLPLRGVTAASDGGLVIGAGELLDVVATHPLVLERAPAVADAAGRVAHPQARRMGTLGGNVCLNVRCRWVNRTTAWRDALGGCLKTFDELCHVVPGGRRCVAALSGDTVPPLAALGAEVEIVGPAGSRREPVAGIRTKDGAHPLSLGPADLVVAIHIPASPERRLAAYEKWAPRKAVDFPQVSVAIVCDRDDGGRISGLDIVVGALGPRPKTIKKLNQFVGDTLDDTLADAVSQLVVKQVQHLPNILGEPTYRQRVLGVLVKRRLASWQ